MTVIVVSGFRLQSLYFDVVCELVEIELVDGPFENF